MAVRPIAVEQDAQLVMGQLERVFLLALQRLQIELTLQIDLIVHQPGPPHHQQQQRQQGLGITAGALEADQGAVFRCFTAQPGAATLHQIGQGITAELAAAAAQHPGQQLGGTALAAWIAAAASPHPQLG